MIWSCWNNFWRFHCLFFLLLETVIVQQIKLRARFSPISMLIYQPVEDIRFFGHPPSPQKVSNIKSANCATAWRTWMAIYNVGPSSLSMFHLVHEVVQMGYWIRPLITYWYSIKLHYSKLNNRERLRLPSRPALTIYSRSQGQMYSAGSVAIDYWTSPPFSGLHYLELES